MPLDRPRSRRSDARRPFCLTRESRIRGISFARHSSFHCSTALLRYLESVEETDLGSRSLGRRAGPCPPETAPGRRARWRARARRDGRANPSFKTTTLGRSEWRARVRQHPAITRSSDSRGQFPGPLRSRGESTERNVCALRNRTCSPDCVRSRGAPNVRSCGAAPSGRLAGVSEWVPLGTQINLIQHTARNSLECSCESSPGHRHVDTTSGRSGASPSGAPARTRANRTEREPLRQERHVGVAGYCRSGRQTAPDGRGLSRSPPSSGCALGAS